MSTPTHGRSSRQDIHWPRGPVALALTLTLWGVAGCTPSKPETGHAVGGAATDARTTPAPPPPSKPDPYDPSLYATSLIQDAEQRARVEYGRALAEQTWKYIGPRVEDASMRFAGNELACKNCHLKAGLQPMSAPWVGVAKRYPNFRKREGREGNLQGRINGCMERSMNGKPLPEEGREMQALVAWMEWLSHLAPEDGKVEGAGFEAFAFPDRAVDLAHGEAVYAARCASCHGADAKGMRSPQGGYVFPALAGDDTYNVGAGMNRVLTAAAFIHANMPLGTTHQAPQLSVEEAFDVAGYVDSLSRPDKANLEADFPDRKLKPMSTPYGPWADPFSAEQHKYGPYAEIRDHYAREHGLHKQK